MIRVYDLTLKISSATLVTYFDKILVRDEISRENSSGRKKSYSIKNTPWKLQKTIFES